MRKTKLRKILDERNISAYFFAKSIGLPARTVQALAAGTRKPSLKTALKIAAGLNIADINKLF